MNYIFILFEKFLNLIVDAWLLNVILPLVPLFYSVRWFFVAVLRVKKPFCFLHELFGLLFRIECDGFWLCSVKYLVLLFTFNTQLWTQLFYSLIVLLELLHIILKTFMFILYEGSNIFEVHNDFFYLVGQEKWLNIFVNPFSLFIFEFNILLRDGFVKLNSFNWRIVNFLFWFSLRK